MLQRTKNLMWNKLTWINRAVTKCRRATTNSANILTRISPKISLNCAIFQSHSAIGLRPNTGSQDCFMSRFKRECIFVIHALAATAANGALWILSAPSSTAATRQRRLQRVAADLAELGKKSVWRARDVHKLRVCCKRWRRVLARHVISRYWSIRCSCWPAVRCLPRSVRLVPLSSWACHHQWQC